jgi:hypothetical protein
MEIFANYILMGVCDTFLNLVQSAFKNAGFTFFILLDLATIFILVQSYSLTGVSTALTNQIDFSKKHDTAMLAKDTEAIVIEPIVYKLWENQVDCLGHDVWMFCFMRLVLLSSGTFYICWYGLSPKLPKIERVKNSWLLLWFTVLAFCFLITGFIVGGNINNNSVNKKACLTMECLDTSNQTKSELAFVSLKPNIDTQNEKWWTTTFDDKPYDMKCYNYVTTLASSSYIVLYDLFTLTTWFCILVFIFGLFAILVGLFGQNCLAHSVLTWEVEFINDTEDDGEPQVPDQEAHYGYRPTFRS